MAESELALSRFVTRQKASAPSKSNKGTATKWQLALVHLKNRKKHLYMV